MLVIAVAGFGLQAESAPTSAKQIVERFVKTDVEGKRLTAKGWRNVDALFVEQSNLVEPKVIVVIGRNYAVSAQTEEVNTNEFYFGYEEVGRISTSSLRLIRTGSGIQSRSFDKYVVVENPVNPTQGGTHGSERPSSAWRIAGAQPETMHLSIAAAIRWVGEKRSSTNDISIRGNADQTLKRLSSFR